MDTQTRTELVWHYTNGDSLVKIIESNLLHASSAAFMNDMNELLSGNIALRAYFDAQRTDLSSEIVEEIETHIPNADARSRHSFILSASSCGDNLTMWRYYGRDQVSYAIGLDRNVPLVPVARLDLDEHPNPPADYYDDMYDRDEAGQIVTDSNGAPAVIFDPDRVIIEGGKWAPVVYDLKRQNEIIADIFEKLRKGAGDMIRPDGERIALWLFPYLMIESLDLIKNSGFRDEKEERIIVWPNPDWKFVFHRPGPYGLVPYIKLTPLTASNHPRYDDCYANSPGRLPIREIRVGPTPYSKEAVRSLKQLLDFHGLHEVRVSHSEIPFR